MTEDIDRWLQLKEEFLRRQPAEVLITMHSHELIPVLGMLFLRCGEVQRLVLRDIIRRNANTEYGKKYRFDQIRSVSDYRKMVPITGWDDYSAYISRMENGKEDVLFAGKPTFFYRTSGTTAAYKLVPESGEEALARRVVTRARYEQRMRLSSESAGKRVFFFFNRGNVFMTEGGIPVGSASGRTMMLAGNGRKDASLGTLAYAPKLVEELEGEELSYMILRLTLAFSDVSAVMGNNARMLTMLIDLAKKYAEELISDIRCGSSRYAVSEEVKALEKEALKPNPRRAEELKALLEADRFTPRYYWKDLKMVSFWLAGSVGVYVHRLRSLLPEATVFIDTGYGASEAKINIPNRPGEPAAPISVGTGFFEFLPEEGKEPLLAEELKDQTTYELLLTTYGGLYRYRLGDYVRVEGFTGKTPNIRFVSKTTDTANLVQEKIPGSMLLSAIREITEACGMRFIIAQVYPDEKTVRYVICIEAEGELPSEESFTKQMEEGLCRRLERYRLYRRQYRLLNPCAVRFMKKGFQDRLFGAFAAGSATASQVKVPVIVTTLPEG